MLKNKAPAKPVQDDISKQMIDAINGTAEPAAPVAPDPVDPGQPVQVATPAKDQVYNGPEWKRGKPAKARTTVIPCIVIDRNDHWNGGALIDLKGADTTAFSWGYYGRQYPVLVEQKKDGFLMPFYLPDAVGESSNRLYKGANPEGFRATFKHRSSLLQKIQVGLMVGLVLGLFFLMYILLNN